MRKLQVFVLLGALLMFWAEPMAGRLLLPSHGAAFHVWTTCLMFFQGVLALATIYTHVVLPRIGRWHLAVAAMGVVFLPVGVSTWSGGPPVANVLATLTVGLGWVFFVLATSGVVAQRWLASSDLAGRDDPWRLYSWSNAGSFVALFAYPLLIEPWFGVVSQRWMWSAAFLAYLGLLASIPSAQVPVTVAERPSLRVFAVWLGLAAAPSLLLSAVTAVVATEVASIPLIWVGPLGVYLMTFIIVFREDGSRAGLLDRFWPEVFAIGLLLYGGGGFVNVSTTAVTYLLILFAACWVAHAELYRRRPAPSQLTSFYVAISVGGWAGGAFAAVVAPAVFPSMFEFPLALTGLGALLLALQYRERWEKVRAEPIFGVATVLIFAVVGLRLGFPPVTAADTPLVRERNFYGLYRVWDDEQAGRPVRTISHGTTVHGRQLLDEKELPLGYYHPASPLADVLRPTGAPRQAAVIGLGAGATAAYFVAGDDVVFYELDPEEIGLARTWFTYLADTKASVRVVAGDARLELERDPLARDAKFDVVLVDAFSGDAIPTHLLTREALELYLSRLAPDGVVVFHVSNRWFDFRPVLAATARDLGLSLVYGIHRVGTTAPFEDASIFVAVSRTAGPLAPLLARGWTPPDHLPVRDAWTDDYSNTLGPLFDRFYYDFQ